MWARKENLTLFPIPLKILQDDSRKSVKQLYRNQIWLHKHFTFPIYLPSQSQVSTPSRLHTTSTYANDNYVLKIRFSSTSNAFVQTASSAQTTLPLVNPSLPILQDLARVSQNCFKFTSDQVKLSLPPLKHKIAAYQQKKQCKGSQNLLIKY